MSTLCLSHQKPPFFPDRAILKRSAILALIIGTVLTFANQWNAIFGIDQFKILSMVLVFQTPFLVISISQVLGGRQALCENTATSVASVDENLIRTMVSHGIPLRAVLVGLLIGGFNTLIVITANMMATGEPGPLPSLLLAQAFTFPTVFGFLSQALSYRRQLAIEYSAHTIAI